MQGWWCVRNGDALAWVEAPWVPQALRRSLDLHALGDWTGDARELVVFPRDAYAENAGPHDYNRNGMITCKEARRHGIAPVPRSHPAYRYMRDGDGDGDGVVCQ